ncbi:MAG TPA: TetR/AcrR family transcriptional regulator [Thermodesulfovibrionales bacterium]|nr:TetR/AcrR family transcriptional regulator [Thermodesulfovibrionales bacterium]
MTTNSGTRKRILEAGLRVFSKKGYLGATTREIAGEAGIAEVTLFRHFSSKEKLFEEVIHTYTFLPALKGLLPELRDMDYPGALSEIAKRFLARLSERRELIQIMNAEVRLYPAKVKEIYHNFVDEIFRTLASYFKELKGKGVLRDFHPELGARAFLGMFFSYFNAREFLLQRKYPFTDESVVHEYVDIFVKGTLRAKTRQGERKG